MPLKRSIRAFILSAFLLRVLVLALLNPLCCHYLPTFEAEPPQHEISISERTSDCAGKPDSTRQNAKLPVFSLCVIERISPFGKDQPASSPLLSPVFGHIRCLAPPAHILFRTFLS